LFVGSILSTSTPTPTPPTPPPVSEPTKVSDLYGTETWVGTQSPVDIEFLGLNWINTTDGISPNTLWFATGPAPNLKSYNYYQVPGLSANASDITTSRILPIISAVIAAISGALLLYQVVRNRCECEEEKCK
jgi:hypothetical protein